MINTAEEFNKLRSSKNLDEQHRAGVEEASIETWKEVIIKYPELKQWVIYNKTIPIDLLSCIKVCNGSINTLLTIFLAAIKFYLNIKRSYLDLGLKISCHLNPLIFNSS